MLFKSATRWTFMLTTFAVLAACGADGDDDSKSRPASAEDLPKDEPFVPQNVSLFSHEVYRDSPSYAPAEGKCPGEAVLKGQIAAILRKRGGPTAEVEAVALFDNPVIDKAVPNCNMRAALLFLLRTPGEGAVRAVQAGTYGYVDYKDDLGREVFAKVIFAAPLAKPSIYINMRYKQENYRFLSVILANQTLHQDGADSSAENLAADALDTLLYGWLLLEEPKLAHLKTELAQRLNTKLLARINSRDTGGNLRLFTARGNVFPGGVKDVANFGAYTGQKVAGDTPGNAALTALLKAAAGTGSAHFNAKSIALLDEHQGLLSAEDLIAIAHALDLDTGE